MAARVENTTPCGYRLPAEIDFSNGTRGKLFSPNAQLLVSGDRKHLLSLSTHQGIEFVTATDDLRRITEH